MADLPELSSVQRRKRTFKKHKIAGVHASSLLELKNHFLPLTLPPPLSIVHAGAAAPNPATLLGLTSPTALLGYTAVKSILYIPLIQAKYETVGVCLTGPQQLAWISQLLNLPRQFVLHADGKHKLHHGDFILITLGTHHLRYDAHHQTLSTQFVPLVYLIKEGSGETNDAAFMLCDALIFLSTQYFGRMLEPSATMSDHSAAFRNAFESRFPDAPFGQCWPHIARKWRNGEFVTTKWKHHGEVGGHLLSIHLGATDQMAQLLLIECGNEWDSYGDKKMNSFWDMYCIRGWDCWSVGQFDGPLCTPSQQAQESWHKQLMESKIPGLFRASTENLVAETLPQLVEIDAIQIPSRLCFHVPAIPKPIMEKALWYVEHQKTHVRATRTADGNIAYFFLRKDNDLELTQLNNRYLP
jgi:hypothetical protein